MQAVPLVPQNSFEVPGLQVWVASSQQPLEQLRVVHTQVPFWHSVPGGHWIQATPPVPQNCSESPVLQVWVVASQQPLEQLAGVQIQL